MAVRTPPRAFFLNILFVVNMCGELYYFDLLGCVNNIYIGT
jgi:hypothetical protein